LPTEKRGYMKTKSRALFIDLLRALALLVMIEVHVFNELLQPGLKQGAWFTALNFINGLVAPSFLFVSGLVFVLSLQKGLDELRTFGSLFWKKMSRIGIILLAAYSLHIPYFSLKKIIVNWSPAIEKQLFIVDVLQCIGIGLLILMFARIFIKSEKNYYIFIAVALALVLILSPIFWNIDFNTFLPIGLASYFNPSNGSLFPVFPWFNFLFAGALTSKFYIYYKEKNLEKDFARRLLLIGLGFFAAGWILLDVLELQGTVVKPHPIFFMQRLGVVLFLLGACWFYVNRKENYKSFMLDVSRESLLVYWFHLQVIFRKLLFGKSLIDMYGGQLDILGCTVVTILICVLMIFFAKGWGWLKTNHPVYSKRTTLAFLTISIVVFLLNNYFLLEIE
jgi:uncharacterized membrane protein